MLDKLMFNWRRERGARTCIPPLLVPSTRCRCCCAVLHFRLVPARGETLPINFSALSSTKVFSTVKSLGTWLADYSAYEVCYGSWNSKVWWNNFVRKSLITTFSPITKLQIFIRLSKIQRCTDLQRIYIMHENI